MNEKEISEIRKHYRLDRSSINHIYGCCINDKKEIISEFDQSLGSMSEDDAEGMLSILKKTLSGGRGRNLHEIEFSTEDVMQSEKYKLISDLRTSGLSDADLRSKLYAVVADNLQLDGGYVVLVAHDNYDVFGYTADGEQDTESSTVFSYIVCAVCPIKSGKPAMSYYMPNKCFRSISADTLIGGVELGFTFPAFDDRSANIYGALYYTKNIKDNHPEVAEALFGKQLPMPAAEQKSTFGEILEKAVGDECKLRVVRSVNAQIKHKTEEHKNEKNEEICRINKSEAGDMLRYCSVDEDKIEKFESEFEEVFGKNAELPTSNISCGKKFEVKTPEVNIKIDSDAADVIETRIIEGTKYILIRADNGAVVNGVNVKF